MNHNSNMNAGGESDGRVLPGKHPNKDGKSSTEGAEGRRPTMENTGQTAASQMQSWGNALDGLQRVREAAKRDKRLRFTALLHHVSVALLTDSFYALKREAAPGVDGLTWQEYEKDLDKRLEDLHSRVHRGTYRALPSKRAYIPKADGRQRPLGIAALEDKIVQHAVGRVLNQIYEQDFLGFSYGFRPGWLFPERRSRQESRQGPDHAPA
jgi:RNA-directed DNA polymerase